MKKKMFLSAVFAGAHGSVGYEHGKEYQLSVVRIKGRYVVNRAENKDDTNKEQQVEYDGMFGFMANWTNVRYITTEEYERKLTFGEKAVGLTFNPSGSVDVLRNKQFHANILDDLNDFRINNAGEKGRLASLAISQGQIAQMCGVKAYTWTDDEDVAQERRGHNEQTFPVAAEAAAPAQNATQS